MKSITEKTIIEALKRVKDPELGFDVWTLGLIYKILIEEDSVNIHMTFTSPFCPFADKLISDITKEVCDLGYKKESVRIELTFTPPWEPSEDLRLVMGI